MFFVNRGSFGVHQRLLVILFIHEKREKALFLKEDNMAKPFLQLFNENIFNPVVSIETLAFEEFLLTML